MNLRALIIPAFAFSLLACASSAADIELKSPLDYQVFQRAEQARGNVRVQGRSDLGDGVKWEFRFSGQDFEAKALPGAWHEFPVEPKAGAFDFQVEAPSGGWYRWEVRATRDGNAVAQRAVEHVGVGEVFIVAGQSNAGSYGSEPQYPESGLVANFDGTNWAVANDPQRGAGGQGGSFMPALGDALAAKFHVPIGLVPIAAGGTSVREWLPTGIKFAQQTTKGSGVRVTEDGQWESSGALFGRLEKRLAFLGQHGFRAVLWHQGESDAGQARSGAPADRQIPAELYATLMETLIRASKKSAGWDVPWFTAEATYHSERDPGDDEFRAAQRSAWEKGLAIPGPDTDALRAEYRKGVHFNPTGLKKHAELWAEHVIPWLDAQLSTTKAEKAKVQTCECESLE